ncbi:MAG: helix-turn-helix transcriptional regulator [Akkermansiaceae bacterium]|nr:helix-turn-helix transcriptional regulator [Akkermansiaceae bacterium]
MKRIRRSKKLTTADVAARCTLLGFHSEHYTISKIERRQRTVSDLEMVLIAEALRIDIKELIPKRKPAWKKDTRPPSVKDEE